MIFSTILHSIRRRWYLLVAGIIASAAAGVYVYQNTDPDYQLSASELLVPGSQTVPEGGNPFLYLGGLAQASDVLVRALGARDIQGPIQSEFPGTSVVIDRDVSTSGPIIIITIEGKDDAAVGEVFQRMLSATPDTLKALQTQANVPKAAQITVLPITVDGESTTNDKGRLQAAALVIAGGLVVTILLLAMVDGLILAVGRRIRGRSPVRRPAAADRDRVTKDTSTTKILPSSTRIPARRLRHSRRRRNDAEYDSI
ncbi:MAG: hypothetical protein QOD27_1810 [Microbacteriaceae bacterium]|jgi:hypothetical protein|nr:hypothetical protein [Microbacteriaceae bacterium]MDQ1550152.1 hypothetical protein [Microbacteriaceae bacterium]